jgi:hypothetical protein
VRKEAENLNGKILGNISGSSAPVRAATRRSCRRAINLANAACVFERACGQAALLPAQSQIVAARAMTKML